MATKQSRIYIIIGTSSKKEEEKLTGVTYREAFGNDSKGEPIRFMPAALKFENKEVTKPYMCLASLNHFIEAHRSELKPHTIVYCYVNDTELIRLWECGEMYDHAMGIQQSSHGVVLGTQQILKTLCKNIKDLRIELKMSTNILTERCEMIASTHLKKVV